nr:retrovirus-related Pol polyprotein from transposon TNT 1-94 [Tanacetum cinerariifolium]
MKSLSPQVVFAAKLPILNPNEFDLWKIRIEQYFLMTDYSLWEVIRNGDSPAPTRVVDGVLQPLKFNSHKDAKTLMEAIEKRFGGNTKTKKVQKTHLKQQYENFTGSSSESLDQIHDRLQKPISQLEILRASLSQEDINLKFLISLPSDWRTHTLIWRNQIDLEEQSLDDLFNTFRFMRLKLKCKKPVSSLPNVDSLSNAVIYSFFASQSSSHQLDNDDLKQIDADDLEEMDLKWQIDMLAVRARSDESLPSSPIYDRYQSGNGYHDVPPPYIGTFMPPKPDLVFNNAPNDVETDHPAFNVKLSPAKPDQDLSHTHRPSAPIIEDWVSDSKNESETKTPQNVPSFIQPSEQVKSPRPYVQHVETSIPVSIPKPTSPKPTSNGKCRNRKTCYVCKSLDHLIKDCDYHEKKMAQPTIRNHAQRGTHKHYARMSFPNPQRHVVPTAVLTQSKSVPITAVRLVTTDVPKIKVTRPRHVKPIVTKPNSPTRRHINHSPSPKASNSLPRVTTVKAPMVNAATGIQGKWKWKPKCLILDHVSRNTSASMTLKRVDYNDALGRSKSGTCPIYLILRSSMVDMLPLEVTQRVKNSVLFTDTKCLVLSPEFKMPDENQVLLRVLRKNDMYNVNLKNIVPFRDLTCLFAKATIDESNIWHRRLSHINFKTINKLVKGNLVRGLPTKVFKNNNTCVACKKGKQHRASCKTKPVNSINQLLYKLHMDLFGPTFVKSLNKKSYYLVVTDDYSRFTWVFFLATKDETSPILKTFITGLENQLSLKGIKREFSVLRTPQQNGIAERKNRTLIEAARTMLEDSLLPIPFWAEAVNTACYVQNRILVTKPQNKTPYELLHGRTPSIGFMRPFGYLVTILNTLDSLSKFNGNVDEGFFVGYSVSSKAFRVFNSRTRIVQETLHVNFLKNKPNVAGSGPTWLFDIDTLTKTMNYQPVTAGNQSNPSAGVQEQCDAEKAREEIKQQCVLFPVCSAQSKKQNDKTKKEAKGKTPVESFTGYRNLSAEFKDFSDNSINEVNAVGTLVPTIRKISPNSTNTFSDVGPSNAAASLTHRKSSCIDTSQLSDDLDMPELEDITYSDDEDDKVWVLVDLSYGKRAIGTKWVFRNKNDERGIMVRNKARLVAQGHTQEEGTNYEEVFASVAMMKAIRLFLAYASFMGFMMYQMDVKSAFLYGTNEEEVYVCQPPGFEDLDYPDKVYKVVKALYGLHQAPRAWYETLANYLLENDFQRGKIDQTLFIKRQKSDILLVQIYVDDIIFCSTNKDLCKAFEKLMKDKFQMSLMGELTFFLGLQIDSGKAASTHIYTEKPLLKDPDGDDVVLSSMESLKRMLHVTNILSVGYLTTPQMFWTTVAVKNVNNVTSEEIFAELARMGYEKPSTKLTFYKAFFSSRWKFLIHTLLQCMSVKRTSWNEFSSSMSSDVICLSSGKGFSGVETPLFEGMLVAQEVGEGVADKVHGEDVNAAGVVTERVVSAADDDAGFPMDLLQTLMDTCTNLSRRVEHLEQDKVAYSLKITKLKSRVKKLERMNKAYKLKRLKKVGSAQRIDTSDDTVMDDVSKQKGIIRNIDANEDVVLEDAKDVAADAKDDQDADIDKSADIQGRTAESQAEIYKIDLDHANKVLSMQEEESEPIGLQEVVEVVTTAKIITEVVTAASTTITAADVPIPTATTAAALTLTAGPSRRTKRVDNVVKRYQALKRKPQTEAQVRKNRMSYLKNVAGFKMDYFKGMTYDDIRPVFKKYFDSNVDCLQKTKEQMDEEVSRALKRLNESQEEKTAKKQKLDEEVEELKRHLQIVPNEEDDVYTEATPLALKVPVVDYEIYNQNNKPYYKIKRADGSHQLYLSFLSLLRNFDREDLEAL